MMLHYIKPEHERAAARHEWQRRHFDEYPVVGQTTDGLDVRGTPWSGEQVKEASGYMCSELAHSIRASEVGWQRWSNPDADWADEELAMLLADDLKALANG